MATAEVLIAVVPYTRHLSSVGVAAGVVIGCPAISVIRCCFVLTTPSAPVTRKSSVVYLPHSSAFPAHCAACRASARSEEHTSELQSQSNLVCRLLLEKKNKHKSHGLLIHTHD